MTTAVSHMTRALELAKRVEGRTSPNPMVGAVIVKNGEIIGEGFHRYAGGPHAEIEALKSCRQSPKGSTLFVTLEPCCFFGKTPPCTQAIIEAQVREVYYAVSDPNPKVAGRSYEILTKAGIDVKTGLLKQEAAFMNRAFFHFIRTALPYVTVKTAQSLDGKIATKTGQSQWITGSKSRQLGHQLRDRSDAILVGSGTVRADDPHSTTRLADGTPHHPVRIVVDSRGRLPLTQRLFQPGMPSKTLCVTTHAAPPEFRQKLGQLGVDSFVCQADRKGHVDLVELMKELARREIMTVMVEGGSTLLGSLVHQSLVQELWAFVNPRIVGGRSALSAIGDPGFDTLDETLRFHWYEILTVNDDVLLKAVNRDLDTPPPFQSKGLI